LSGKEESYFSYALSKEHCQLSECGQEIKNLSFFCEGKSNRELESCILIDNNIQCFAPKLLTNGIPIPKYEGQSEDGFFYLLGDYLITNFSQEKCGDVRKIISRDFGFEQIVDATRTSKIRQMMTK